MPAFIAGALLSVPIEHFLPGLPESALIAPALLFVPLLWWACGRWLDRRWRAMDRMSAARRRWAVTIVYILICAGVASTPNIRFFAFGSFIWLLAGVGIAALAVYRKLAVRHPS
jgi:hypothetical protein